MRRMNSFCACALLAVLFSVSVCAAQTLDVADETAPRVLPTANELETPAAPAIHLNFIDQKLALSLAVDTQSQIEAAEFALKSISNEALRRHVAARLEQQRAFAQRLDALTDGRAKQAIVDALAEIEADKAAAKPRAVSFRPAALQRYATALLVRVRLEILQQCETIVQGELAGKSAAEFDRCFLRNDVLRQLQMLATLKVFEAQASGDFAQVIHEAWLTARQHYDHAKGLLVQLETEPLAGAAAPSVPLVEGNAAR
jgi:hypothetical protein